MSESNPGFIRRTWRFITAPLLLLGIAIGFVLVVGTQVMVHATGTDQFCGTACHSMQWVAKEHKESVHGANRTGVKAGCHDCHIPHEYPHILFYKAKAGIKDAIGEMQGVISTEEKFNKERLRMAKHVWEEYQGNNSRACRHCHQFSKEVIAKQKEEVRPIHEAVLAGNGTCVDCHKGVGHKAPQE